MKGKKGIFFTIDAILAAGILIVIIILISSSYVSQQDRTSVVSYPRIW